MAKRYWGDYGRNLIDEAGRASGILGIVGGATAAGGAVLGAPVIVPAAGAAFLVFGLGVCAFRAIPEKSKTASDYIGKGAIDISVLAKLRENPITVGIVGVEDSGKSTLVKKLHNDEGQAEDTTRVQAYILETINRKQPYALLDGAGELWAQQMSVAEQSNILILLCDHNAGENQTRLIFERLSDHKNFAEQVAHQIKDAGNTKRVLVYTNKFDQWSKSKNSDDMEACGLEIHTRLAPLVDSAEVRPHSNKDMNNGIRAKTEIDELVFELMEARNAKV